MALTFNETHRVLAALCNRDMVRQALAQRGIMIPAETRFIAGEHITSLDRIDWTDAPGPQSIQAHTAFAQLQVALADAMAQVQTERLAQLPLAAGLPARSAWQNSHDISETRPEWGLSRNAAFIIGQASFTRGCRLDGRAFLHSYDWRQDSDASLLGTILAGPRTVAQWINLQYYASNVAPHYHGSGHKATQSGTAQLGVMQGNGSDLQTGLPWQALARDDAPLWHVPQRLLLVMQAPEAQLARVLEKSPALAQKLANGWLSLTSYDPELLQWKNWT